MASREEMKARLLELLGPDNGDKYPHCLETRFPHVFEKICALWGKPELDTYFQQLMTTTRPGRQGFPTEAATEIFRLSNIHQELGLTKAKPIDSIWEAAADVDYWKGKRGGQE